MMLWFVDNLAGAKNPGTPLRLPDIYMQCVIKAETYIFAKFVVHAIERVLSSHRLEMQNVALIIAYQ